MLNFVSDTNACIGFNLLNLHHAVESSYILSSFKSINKILVFFFNLMLISVEIVGSKKED
jgi:hypothetical protein